MRGRLSEISKVKRAVQQDYSLDVANRGRRPGTQAIV